MTDYSYGPYNEVRGNMQAIRITEGCPNNCPYCREPQEFKFFGIPEIVRNKVLIYDMNLLAKPQAACVLEDLGNARVNGRVVYYELTCGVDYRFMTPHLARLLRENRFGNFNKGSWTRNIKMAWDWDYGRVRKVFDSVKMLLDAGFAPWEISMFIICNWKISFTECMKKLQVLGIWNVMVNDCYFDNQTFPHVEPVHWTYEQLRCFRDMCRTHNMLIRFRGYNPEVNKTLSVIRRREIPV